MFLIFDTETTGLPKRWNAPLSDTENWPRCIQIAWQLHDNNGVLIEHEDYLIHQKDLMFLMMLRKFMEYLQN